MRVNVRDEINLTRVVLRAQTKRLQRKVVLYGRNRSLGWGVRRSWAGAEAEISAAEWAEVRELADRFLFRLEVERDLASLHVSGRD